VAGGGTARYRYLVEAGRALTASAEGESSQRLRSSASKPQLSHRRKDRHCGTKAGNDRWNEGSQESRSAMKTPKEEPPSLVPATGKQGGEACAIQAWAEPSVWTEPMLMALERGIKGGKWFSLIDKVWNPRNLESSWHKVRRNGGAAGPDGCSVSHFEREAAVRLEKLGKQLREGTYTARP